MLCGDGGDVFVKGASKWSSMLAILESVIQKECREVIAKVGVMRQWELVEPKCQKWWIQDVANENVTIYKEKLIQQIEHGEKYRFYLWMVQYIDKHYKIMNI